MVLPSGKAIRLNADKLNEINEAIDALTKKPGTSGTGKGSRKRKPSIDSLAEVGGTSGGPSSKIEYLLTFFSLNLNNYRKREVLESPIQLILV